jgi:hypothetical protein
VVGYTENAESTEGAESGSRLLTEEIIGAAIDVRRGDAAGRIERVISAFKRYFGG